MHGWGVDMDAAAVAAIDKTSALSAARMPGPPDARAAGQSSCSDTPSQVVCRVQGGGTNSTVALAPAFRAGIDMDQSIDMPRSWLNLLEAIAVKAASSKSSFVTAASPPPPAAPAAPTYQVPGFDAATGEWSTRFPPRSWRSLAAARRPKAVHAEGRSTRLPLPAQPPD